MTDRRHPKNRFRSGSSLMTVASSLPLGLAVCVDGERVDCECRVDFLLPGGSAAVGGWLID